MEQKRRSKNALLNYRLRIVASIALLAIFASIPEFHHDPKRWGMVAFIILWPHLFYWRASRAGSGYQAERFNTLLDNIYEGVLLFAVSFRLWPSMLILTSGALNTLAMGGWRLMLRGVGFLLIGLGSGYLIFGFDLHPETEPLATGLSFFTIVTYVMFVGALIYGQRTRARAAKEALEVEQENSQTLLLKVFPEAVIPRLNVGENPIADEFADVTVLFSDIVGYTPLAEQLGPRKTVMLLNDLYSRFDQIAAEHGVEKIETVGDGYLAVGGAPVRNDEHPEAVAQCALAMIEASKDVMASNNEPVQIRIGLHTGPIFAGVIGEHRFHYAIFGETVNVASRVQGHSEPGNILVSETTYKRIKSSHELEKHDVIELKGHGPMKTYWLQNNK